MSEDTDHFEKAAEGFGQGLAKGIGALLLAGGVFTGSVWHSTSLANQDARKIVWTETGDHFQDLVKIVQEQQKQIDALSNQVNELKYFKP